MGYYPIVINITDLDCLVVGGGEVAVRKVKSLLDAGARVTVIAPDTSPELDGLDRVTLLHRGFQPGDTAGKALVYAATDDRELNRAVFEEAKASRIPVNVVDDPELCTFIVPASVHRDSLLISVTTSGRSPALAKHLRRELECRYGPEYGQLVDILGRLRDEVKAAYSSYKDREAAFTRVINGGILELLREGKRVEAEARARELIG